MCTLTVIPAGPDGFRLAFNRDESRTRAAALPPEPRRFGRRHAMMPIDPASGGTWIAVNDAGLVLALLNVSLPNREVNRARRSRGGIIPDLLHHASLGDVAKQVESLAFDQFPPFRLVAIHDLQLSDWKSDGSRLTASGGQPIARPLLFTSSGLGDHLVEQPRRELFERMFERDDDWEQRQDQFHRHSWPDRPHLSVCMRRSDACTVSHTLIERDPRGAWMSYYPGAPDEPAPAAMARIAFDPAGGR